METVDSISNQAFIAKTFPRLLLGVDSAAGSGSAQVDLGAVKLVAVTAPVLHWTTELATLSSHLGDTTLLHVAIFTDGTAPVLGVVEAGGSRDGESVFVVWNSLAAVFSVGALAPFMHGEPTLFAAINTLAADLPPGGVEGAESIGYRLLILPFPLHLGPLHVGLSVGRLTGTLAAIFAIYSAVLVHLQLSQHQG